MKPKTKSPQDATRRNVQAANKKLSVHNTRLKEVEKAVRAHGKSIKQLTASLERFNAQMRAAKGL